MDEETKQRLLEELRKEYKVELKPLPKEKLNINTILDKYTDEICHKIGIMNNYRDRETIHNAIRRVMCFSYGYWTINEIPCEEYDSFKADTEKFIKEIILKERN